MRFSLLAALSASLLCADCAAPPPVDETPAVLAAENRLCDAYLHSDASGLEAGLTPDFTQINGKGELSTKLDDLDDAYSGSVRYTRFANREMKVRFYDGSAAVVTGYTDVAGSTAAGKSFELTVRFTDTLVKTNSGWRLAAGQSSSPVAASVVPPAAKP